METRDASSSSFEYRISIFPVHVQLTRLPTQTDLENIYCFVPEVWSGLQSSAHHLPQLSYFIPKRFTFLLLLPSKVHSSCCLAFVTYLPASNFPIGAEIKQAAHMPWLTCCLFPSLPSGLFAQPKGKKVVGEGG